MRVVAVPCLKDNFAYLVIEGTQAAVVDPSAAAPVEAALERAGVELAAIWLTHHHWDHVGGVPDLTTARPGLPVVASAKDSEKIKGVTQRLADEEWTETANLRAYAIDNPGHTLGAISFRIADAVFTGDTLFGAGCGRMFEGDPAMMHASLMKLAALPGETRLYFGHEYTQSNLRFAAAVEPSNRAVADRAAAIPAPSTPSTVDLELATNPFLRCSEPAVIEAALAHGAASREPHEVFRALRAWKDTF